ncbi:glycosyltransferase family 2 protein [Roseomonas chloroacetimidivorans]|uniref:glycosyltransferase family 2 protein n=1 Tax=Roseomonas chloroacetimidivorans TaxID=1766656 RepID=UPI003C726B9E
MDALLFPIAGRFLLEDGTPALYGWASSLDEEPVVLAVQSAGKTLTLLHTTPGVSGLDDAPEGAHGFRWRIPSVFLKSDEAVPLQVVHLGTGEPLEGPGHLPPHLGAQWVDLAPAAEPAEWPHGLAAALPPGLIEVATGYWLWADLAAQGVRLERAAVPDLPGAPEWAIRVVLSSPAAMTLHQRIAPALLPQLRDEGPATVRLFAKLARALEPISQAHLEIGLSHWDGQSFAPLRRIRRSRLYRPFSWIDLELDLAADEIALQREGNLVLSLSLPSSPGMVACPIVLPVEREQGAGVFEDSRLDETFAVISNLARGHNHVVEPSLLPPEAPLRLVPEVRDTPEVPFTQIILPVYNGAEVVRDCLESVRQRTDTPFQLLMIDDGSRGYTRHMLEEFARIDPRFLLHRRDVNRGYTKSINEALKLTSADWVVILNSDTVVSQGWLRKLHAATRSQPNVGMVGPLSNAATWQSVPEVKNPDASWSTNAFIDAHHVPAVQAILDKVSERAYPTIPVLNGFATLIHRRVFEVLGLFDEEAFPVGYGEETDMCLRAGRAGFKLLVADDCFVYHQKSVSFGSATRSKLSRAGSLELRNKHAGINIPVLERSMQRIPSMVRLRTALANLPQELA